MQPSTQVWTIAEPARLWRQLYQAFGWFMVLLAMVWLWQFSLSLSSVEAGLGHGLAACSLLCWLVLAWHEFRHPSPPLEALTLHWASPLSSHQSPWSTPQGDVATVQVLMDWGRHLLLSIEVQAPPSGSNRRAVRARQAKVKRYFRWVSEAELTGPWRWRVHAWHHPHP